MYIRHRTYPEAIVYTSEGEKVQFGQYAPHFCEVDEAIGKDLIERHKDIEKATRDDVDKARAEYEARQALDSGETQAVS